MPTCVCCAAAVGGDNLQDLKAGYIVGATPWKQQLMLGIGAFSCALIMAPVLNLLAQAYGIGDPTRPGSLQAPQATLMASVAQGLFGGKLPWDMIAAGGVIGALSAAGLARGFNLVRGVDKPTLAWADDVLDELVHSALLGYLAVAHFGRGRGNWVASEQPAFWPEQVSAALAAQRKTLQAIWSRRTSDDDRAALTAELQSVLRAASLDVFIRIYPDSKDMLRATDG